MAIADPSTTTAKVKQQYEMFPYPQRDPAAETRHLRRTHLDELDRLNHYCFRGRRDFRRGFRALVAGGGTGDSVISLGCQLAGAEATLVYLDLSKAALEIARQRARARGLEERITWISGSLLELPEFGLEPFDYISCTGVLHHLDDPAAGLAALTSVLKDDGALGLMLYGRYGRTGVYQVQELMRLVNHDEQHPQTMLQNTKEVLAALPESNWYKRPPAFVVEGDDLDDTHLYDIFLHARDRAFSVPELYDLLDGAHLHLVEFIDENRALYDARFAFRSPRLQSRLAKLPLRSRQAAAELFWGGIDKHEFWASRRTDTVARPHDPQNVPTFSNVARLTGMPESLLTAVNDPSYQNWQPSKEVRGRVTIAVKLVLNDVNRQFIRLIDGRRTTGEIVQTIVQNGGSGASADQVWQICRHALEALRMFDFVLLRHQSTPAI